MTASPDANSVVVAWVSSIPELEGTGVATRLPPITQWRGKKIFVTTRTVGGAPDPYTGLRAPVASIHCWSPPGEWKRANNLATVILESCFGDGSETRRVTISSSFYPADVKSVLPQREPIEILSDPMDLAHVSFDLQLVFAVRRP